MTINRNMLPFYRVKTLLIISFLLIAVSTPLSVAEEEITWEQASSEVDGLPFSRHFIDSLKQVFNITEANRALRSLRPLSFARETLVYEVAWGPFKAGYVILSTEFDPADRTIRLGGKALSSNFVSAFYKMRDYVVSTIDADGLYPIFFETHLREGRRYKADHWILFDNSQGKLHVKEKTFKSIDAPPFIQDYLSMLYYVRSTKTAPGDTFSLSMYTDSKIYPIHFSCKENKNVEIELGTYSCSVIEPKLVGDGRTFNRKDKLEVLISDDSLRLPILIKSKIKLGYLTAKLIWFDNKS